MLLPAIYLLLNSYIRSLKHATYSLFNLKVSLLKLSNTQLCLFKHTRESRSLSPLSLRRGSGRGCFFPTPSPQKHLSISLIVLPLPSERAGERLLFTPLSFRRGLGRGCIGCVSGCFFFVQSGKKACISHHVLRP